MVLNKNGLGRINCLRSVNLNRMVRIRSVTDSSCS